MYLHRYQLAKIVKLNNFLYLLIYYYSSSTGGWFDNVMHLTLNGYFLKIGVTLD